MSIEIFASSWKNFRGRVRYSLNHTPCTRGVEMACYFEVAAMVRGYHQYKEIWDAEFGEKLECQRETGNSHDIFAVAVLKSGVIVGTGRWYRLC